MKRAKFRFDFLSSKNTSKILAFLSLCVMVLSIVLYVRTKKCSSEGFNQKTKFNPPPLSGQTTTVDSNWINACQSAFQNYDFNKDCQDKPLGCDTSPGCSPTASDCADYPIVFCNGKITATGD